mgnify:CR=1 FL=1
MQKNIIFELEQKVYASKTKMSKIKTQPIKRMFHKICFLPKLAIVSIHEYLIIQVDNNLSLR